MKDAYKSMMKAVGKYLNAANKQDLMKEAGNLSEYVPETLARKLDKPVSEIPSWHINNAYTSIEREFKEGAEAIEYNRSFGHNPSISYEDFAYKTKKGIERSISNLEEDLWEKGKDIESPFTNKYPSERSQEKPSLTIYDNARDGEYPYEARYGVFEFDDKEPKT